MVSGLLRDLTLRLRALVHRRRLETDLDDELAFHLAMRAAQLEATGAEPVEAARAARRQFGNVTAIHERMRELWNGHPRGRAIRDGGPEAAEGAARAGDRADRLLRRSRAVDQSPREEPGAA